MKKDKINHQKINVVILMNRFHVGANILLNKIINDHNIEIRAILIRDVWKGSKKRKNSNPFIAFWNWGSKTGYYFLFGLAVLTIIYFVKLLIIEILLIGILFKERNYFKTTNRLAKDNKIKIHKINDINDKDTETLIKNLNPDVLLSNNYHQIIKKNILGIAKYGAINIHPGKLPLYRGMLPHFWNMVHKEDEGGVTLHYMDPGVDTGQIIMEDKFKIDKNDSFYQVWTKTALSGSKILKKYFKKLRNNHIIPKKNIKNKKQQTFFFPGKKAFLKFKKNGFHLYRIKDFFK